MDAFCYMNQLQKHFSGIIHFSERIQETTYFVIQFIANIKRKTPQSYTDSKYISSHPDEGKDKEV